MLSEPIILYKLMNPYMLKRMNFPLTDSQLSGLLLEHEYTAYFTLQQAFSELLEAGLIHTESNCNTFRYETIRGGEGTLSFFGKNISPAIIDNMDKYLKENWFCMRDEIGTVADYYKPTNQDYTVHYEVRKGKTTLIDLDLSIPDREQAESMYSSWGRKSQEICAFTMKTLMSD